MPRGDKSAYSDKQKRQAEHIEESVRERGGSGEDAERIGWATVNKETGGARGRKKTAKKSARKSTRKSPAKKTARKTAKKATRKSPAKKTSRKSTRKSP